jgi:rhodanese-related sulfurtransferase
MSILKKIFGGNEKEETADPILAAPPPTPEPEPAPIQINEVTPDELKARLDNGDEVLVIDMRQPWEYQAGHIPGAKNVFIQEIPARMDEFPKDVDIVFQCWHGNTSLDASGYLIHNGWAASRVSSLSGGIAGWVQTHGQKGLVTN